MSRVSIVKCSNYAQAIRKTKKALDKIETTNLVKDGSKILLKVNLIMGAPPEKAVNTHPEVIRGTGRYFKEKNCEVTVADSSGTKGFTSEAFKVSGIKKVCE